ncbi:hypothetical protein [Mammaliicoccus vitulinus]|uniref:hypothetical protein n=1 Tax=Mammaliicoccus vitulinus TaxID=71237 RepID=UPI00248BF19E|nr:hypothetical protein [Mammaliicoccus vitulinus]
MNDRNNKKNMFASLKIKKDYKVLFDELSYQNRSNQWQFLEILLEHWCENNNQEVYEDFKKGILPGQENNTDK